MRTQLLYNEAFHHKQTETKTKGRRTGESSAVISMPRIDWVRSDLPPLFNQKLFIMRTQNDGAKSPTASAILAEQIEKHFKIYGSDDIQNFRDDLKTMAFCKIVQEPDKEMRDTFHWVYSIIDQSLGLVQISKA